MRLAKRYTKAFLEDTDHRHGHQVRKGLELLQRTPPSTRDGNEVVIYRHFDHDAQELSLRPLELVGRRRPQTIINRRSNMHAHTQSLKRRREDEVTASRKRENK